MPDPVVDKEEPKGYSGLILCPECGGEVIADDGEIKTHSQGPAGLIVCPGSGHEVQR